ncbi:MAG TPA: hypothetical protein VFV46_04580 [Lacibacter sp.]|nr:hypothetical protein [Lacibacter sp.]
MKNLYFYRKWILFTLFNFVILAAVGVLLRYKILFPLPAVEQKHLLHGHSHFAFAGWVSLSLYVLTIYLIQPGEVLLKKLEWLLVAQQMASYGMLFSFPFTGYATVSISFSTASIFISWAFAWLVLRELNQNKQKSIENKWIITGQWCNILSSLGTFTLAYLMVTKNLRQDWYFGSVYFFLHFQYNGFFLFSIGALFINVLSNNLQLVYATIANRFFNLLLFSLLPAWFLSLMWMRIPQWMYITGVGGAIIQLGALWYFIQIVRLHKQYFQTAVQPIAKWFWYTAGAAFSVKIILQALSAIPQLNTYAFGVRPIVIGFLHLVLLVFVSMFLIGYFLDKGMLVTKNKSAKLMATGVLISVLLNEVFLMLQGVAAMSYHTIPYMNHALLICAIFIFLSLSGLLLYQYKKSPARNSRT